MKDETQETSDKAAPEPLAAILREMRAAAKSTDLFNGEEVGEPLIRGSKVKDYADRIEAAVKRELSRAAEDAASKATLDRTAKDAAEYMAYAMAHSAPQSGDAAALREALRELRDAERKFYHQILNSRHSEILDKYTCAEQGFPAVLDVRRAIVAASDALAAPPRNCDRFDTVDEARREFQKIRGHKVWADIELWDDMDEVGAFVRWLFAPAEGTAKCVNGLRGEPDCRGCEEHCEAVRKRNCFYWNPDIEGGVCALTGKKSCPITCDNFHIPEKVSPSPAEGVKE